MRAVWITKNGGTEVLAVRESPSPVPGPGEILVRVRATGLGLAEVLARQGSYPLAPKPPCVVGYDAAGVVEAHGPGVSFPEIGTRVMVICHFGAHAELLVTSAQLALPIPESLSFEEAACIPWNYLVAYHLVFRVANVRSGERVLVHSAGGGVGIAILQFLRTIPGTVIYGTASSAKHEALKSEGCHHAVDYRKLDYAKEITRITDGKGVDVVLDPLGGKDWRRGFELLRPAGRLVAYGFANMKTGERRNPVAMLLQLMKTPRFSPVELLETNRTVSGVSTGRFWRNLAVLADSFAVAVELCEKHRLCPRVDSVHSFAQAAQAHRRIEERQNTGRVILTP